MLCEQCKKTEATCFLCEVSEEGESRSRNLCVECFEAESPGNRKMNQALRSAKCEYCGGQPCAGGTDTLAICAGIFRMKFMCFPCGAEYRKFTSDKLSKDADKLSQQEQMALIRKLMDDADAHMKRWISER